MNDIVLRNYTLLSRDEHKALLAIRNSDRVRLVSNNTQIIALADHLQFVKTLEASRNRYFAVLVGGKTEGGTAAIFNHGRVKWGVFFSEEASILVKSMVPICFLDYVFKELCIDEIHLDIKKTNENAIAFDRNLGFTESGGDGELRHMSMNKAQFESAKQSPYLKRILRKSRQYNIKFEDQEQCMKKSSQSS